VVNIHICTAGLCRRVVCAAHRTLQCSQKALQYSAQYHCPSALQYSAQYHCPSALQYSAQYHCPPALQHSAQYHCPSALQYSAQYHCPPALQYSAQYHCPSLSPADTTQHRHPIQTHFHSFKADSTFGSAELFSFTCPHFGSNCPFCSYRPIALSQTIDFLTLSSPLLTAEHRSNSH